MKKLALAFTLALAAMTTTAGAYDNQREIDARQAAQERRIQQGLRSGELTRREAHALAAEQARIRDLERRAQRDGRIDRHEAAEIRRAQNDAARHIYQETHDGQRRSSWWYRRWW